MVSECPRSTVGAANADGDVAMPAGLPADEDMAEADLESEDEEEEQAEKVVEDARQTGEKGQEQEEEEEVEVDVDE